MELLTWAEGRNGVAMHVRKKRSNLVNWNSKMETGIREVDEQHKQLVGLINQLNEAMYAGKGRDLLGHTLVSLEKYALFHFGTEERLMAVHGYSEAASHKRGHQSFIDDIRRFRSRFDAGRVFPVEIMFFLREWIIYHIMLSDRDLGHALEHA